MIVHTFVHHTTTTMSTITEQVGHLIKETRKAKGMTQKELGEKVGVSVSVVSKYEAGRQNLSLDTVAKVANALGVQFVPLFK